MTFVQGPEVEYPPIDADGWKDYGDISAVDPPYAVPMECAGCMVRWRGCWDIYQCPECGEGELPRIDDAPKSGGAG